MKTITTFALKFFVTIVMAVWFVLTACSIDSLFDNGKWGYILAVVGVLIPLIVIPKMWKQ